MYRKAKTAITADLAVYSSHLPLDLHPKFGNCALLAKALGFRKFEPAFPFKGRPIGLKTTARIPVRELRDRLTKVLGSTPHLAAGGPAMTRCIGILTGGAGGEVGTAAAEGVDTFITGEGPHHSYTLAEELGINLFYGGHYATETFGVKALAAHLSRKFRVPWEFIDHPTGL
jgi:putative NIF3 family GTP cyclohydrolase 1 type 2